VTPQRGRTSPRPFSRESVWANGKFAIELLIKGVSASSRPLALALRVLLIRLASPRKKTESKKPHFRARAGPQQWLKEKNGRSLHGQAPRTTTPRKGLLTESWWDHFPAFGPQFRSPRRSWAYAIGHGRQKIDVYEGLSYRYLRASRSGVEAASRFQPSAPNKSERRVSGDTL